MKIIVTNIKRPYHCDVIVDLAADCGFGRTAIEFGPNMDCATIYVGTVQARSAARIAESEVYELIAKTVMLGAIVTTELDAAMLGAVAKTELDVHKVDRPVVQALVHARPVTLHGTAAEPAKPFIDSRFNKVE